MGIKEIYFKRKKYFENYLKHSQQIKKLAKEFFKEKFLKMFVFGSVVRGDYSIGLSDIDIAIILKKGVHRDEKVRFLLLIDEKFPENPFEIHIVSEEKWKSWYAKFVKENFIEV